MSKKRAHEEHASNAYLVPHWYVTFSDMRVVLLCFFVLLVGFSSKGKDSAGPAPGSLGGYNGISESSTADSDSLVSRMPSSGGGVQLNGYDTAPDHEPLNYSYQGFDLHIRTKINGNPLEYRMTARGFEIQISCGTMFEENSATLKPEAEAVLTGLADCLRNLPHYLRIQTRPDDFFVPSEEFPTSETLALRRSAAICAGLSEKAHIPAERLSVGTGLNNNDGRPNDSAQVAIVVLAPPKVKTL